MCTSRCFQYPYTVLSRDAQPSQDISIVYKCHHINQPTLPRIIHIIIGSSYHIDTQPSCVIPRPLLRPRFCHRATGAVRILKRSLNLALNPLRSACASKFPSAAAGVILVFRRLSCLYRLNAAILSSLVDIAVPLSPMSPITVPLLSPRTNGGGRFNVPSPACALGCSRSSSGRRSIRHSGHVPLTFSSHGSTQSGWNL